MSKAQFHAAGVSGSFIGGSSCTPPTKARSARGGFQCVLPAMFQIGGLVAGNQLDHACPQPGWSIQAFGAIAIQIRSPSCSRFLIHLLRMRFANYRCQVSLPLQLIAAGQPRLLRPS